MYERFSNADARDRLRVFRAATEEGAPRYLAILGVFIEARERYELEVTTEQVTARLRDVGVETDNLDAALAQLKEWGNLSWTQDTTRVARLDDFRRRKALWQLTAAGQAAYEAVGAVLDADDQQGSLQRTLLRDIRDGLAQLTVAIDGGDAEAVYLRLRDLDGALQDLASNARAFHASVTQLRREHDVDPDRFLAYKHLLIEYLEQFLEHLTTQREQVARAVGAVEQRGVDRMVALSASGDDSAGLFGDGDREEIWRRRWAGLAAWFVRAPGAPSGADDLEAATISAIRDLLSMLRRVVESSRRPITRASELVTMARWFRRLTSDEEAAELFDAAFGLGWPLHLGGHPKEVEPPSPTASWRSTPPVLVPLTLREHGRRPSPGRPAPAVDYRKEKARLAAGHAALQEARARAAAQLVARPIEGRVLSDPEVGVLFELLDRAAHRRAVGAATADLAPVVIEGAAAVLVGDPAGMVLQTRRGTLTFEAHRIEVGPAGGAR